VHGRFEGARGLVAEYRVEVHGSVGGNLVVGDHNLIVNAAVGSSVSVVQEALRPKPVRRPDVRVLPRRQSPILGRTSEIGTITAAVVGQSTIQVYGPAGVGKSTLLRQAAYDIADEADGVIFLSATGRSHIDIPQEIFEACYETSGYRPSPTELRRLMTGVRAAVVADDLVCSPDELAGVLDAAPDAAFVFAATDRELYGSGQVIELHGLSEPDAVALVRRELGRDLSAAESAVVRQEWQVSGGSPMRLLRAAASLGRRSESASEQATVPLPAPASSASSAASATPAASAASVAPIAVLVESLPAAERDVYRLLSFVAPATVTVPIVAALVATDHFDHVAAAVDRLARIGLVERAGDAVRIAEDLVVPVDERSYRRDPAALVLSLRNRLTEPAEVADHGDLIVRLVEAAVAADHADLAIQLARSAAPLAALSLRWGVWRDVLTSGQAAAKAGNDDEAYAYFTHERGIRLLCLGQAAAAAAVLATAAGLWHALGLHVSAAAATSAQAIAGGAAHAAGLAHVPPSPVQAAPHAPVQPAPHAPVQPAPHAPPAPMHAPAPRRTVGRARVGAGRSGFPTALVVTIAVVVLALVVAAFIVVPHLRSRPVSAPVASPTASASFSAAPSPSLAPPPTPVAFSDNSATGSDPSLILDGDPATVWSSAVVRTPTTDDSWIAIDMGVAGEWSGLSVTPRAHMANFPTGFQIETSSDDVTWTTVPGQVYGADNPYQPSGDGVQVFTFAAPVQARYIRFFATVLAPDTVARTAVFVGPYTMQIADMHVISD
jgi:hypothetical protein